MLSKIVDTVPFIPPGVCAVPLVPPLLPPPVPVAATNMFIRLTGAFVVSGRSRDKGPCSEMMVPVDS